MTGGSRLGRWAPPLAVIVTVIALWEIWVDLADTPDWLLPSPRAIAATLLHDRRLLLHHGWVTLQEVLIGFAVAALAGVALAVVIDAFPMIARAIYPIAVASQAVPIVALAPLLLVWFGYGLLPKVIVTALVAFFPMAVTTVDGLRSVDRDYLDLLRTMGAGRWSRMWLVKAPWTLPAFFSGARIGIAVAVIGAVFGEYVGANAGLGYLMNISSGRLLTDRVFACIVVLSAMAILLFTLVGVVERRLLPWRRLEGAAEP